MKQMQLRDAKAKLSEVVDAVVNGEPTTITRHGVPVAMVVPFSKGEEIYPEAPKKTFGQHLLEYPGGIDFDEIRDPSPMREIDL